MKKQISLLIQKQQFDPGFLGIFVNPFFFVRRELRKNIAEFAPSLFGKILDAGCAGKPYEVLFSNATEYIGMEFDSSVNRADSKADVFYDGHKFPFQDNTFDGVVATQVLEHVFNPDEFLDEMNRVVKHGAHVLLTLPFVWDEHSQPHDYARYTSFGLRHLLEKHGFIIIKSKKTLNDVRVIFQLINCYLFKIISIKNYRLRLIFHCIFISPFTIIGQLFSLVLPKNDDLYMDNIILARKK